MTGARSTAQWLNFGGVVLLAGVILAWQAFDTWPGGSWWGAWLLGVPLAFVAAMHLSRRRSATFWAGVLALLTFSHGVMEAWASPPARLPALAEVLLSVAIVLSASWDGLRARALRGRTPPAV